MKFNQLPRRVRREVLESMLMIVHFRVTGNIPKALELEQALKIRARKLRNARYKTGIRKVRAVPVNVL